MSRQLELFNEAKQKWITSTKESAKRDYNFDTLSGESLDTLYFPEVPSDDYLDKLINIVTPSNLIYLAIDGVAPAAKMQQQARAGFKWKKTSLREDQTIERYGTATRVSHHNTTQTKRRTKL